MAKAMLSKSGAQDFLLQFGVKKEEEVQVMKMNFT